MQHRPVAAVPAPGKARSVKQAGQSTHRKHLAWQDSRKFGEGGSSEWNPMAQSSREARRSATVKRIGIDDPFFSGMEKTGGRTTSDGWSIPCPDGTGAASAAIGTCPEDGTASTGHRFAWPQRPGSDGRSRSRCNTRQRRLARGSTRRTPPQRELRESARDRRRHPSGCSQILPTSA